MAVDIYEEDTITFANYTVHERLARLEANGRNRDEKLEEIKSDVKILLSKFDQLTGGKRVLLGITTFLGAILAGIVSWIFRHSIGH